jgi:hypothetical protein
MLYSLQYSKIYTLKMEAPCSSETSVTNTRLQDVITQKSTLRIFTAVKNLELNSPQFETFSYHEIYRHHQNQYNYPCRRSKDHPVLRQYNKKIVHIGYKRPNICPKFCFLFTGIGAKSVTAHALQRPLRGLSPTPSCRGSFVPHH